MRQKTFYDEAEPVVALASIARRSDPVTSHKAAAETETRINTLQFFVFDAIRKATKPLTSNEAAIEAAKQYVAAIETFRKRVRELVRLDLLEEAGERRCEITGKGAMTFKVKVQQ